MNVICFGEVLWDVFPTHKTIGGAPLNVALRLSSFGHEVAMVSAVGNDDDGKKIISFMDSNNVLTEHVQIDHSQKTSQVHVTLDQQGTASYTIAYPCAWDFIRVTPALDSIIRESDAIIFGSLVTRNRISRETLTELLEVAKYKVFDVNLRPPHYNMDILTGLMHAADFIKFNDEELLEISQNLGFEPGDIEDSIKYIAERTNTQTICVTMGKNGAVLFLNGKFYKNNGCVVKVKDTVGSGDSFLASLVHNIINDNDPRESLDFACAVGALVAASEGANPIISNKDIQLMLRS